ncbi:hypothetical protein PSYG_00070 [Psychrobacter phage pOW20-A]|uniref:hypothetical protein n=2 Tax=Psychrobacter phage pOW20-A TaxID=754048 RepID=UPI0002C18B87|nr:hypothetical protein PSYG_00070 [Psychrobacter phage pOW20-A]AGH57531.1 hypothetical protein PSYG_00070 [Psychrobacter phage pOW20-A]
MSIEKVENFAEIGDKNLNGLDVSEGFPREEKPERPWFNYLFHTLSNATNQIIDGIESINTELDNTVRSKDFNIIIKDSSPKNLEYFNNSDIKVGSDNASVDSIALQNALTSEYAIDLAGLKLKIDRTINVNRIESCIMSSIPYQRNGSGHALRSANIEVVDDALPILFNTSEYNCRFSGFRIRCNTTNSATQGFYNERSNFVQSDVDILINDVTMDYGLRFVNQRGRGLDLQRCSISGLKDMAIRLDWDSRWIPNGQSNDENGTAQRAYTIADIRQHGCLGLVENIGDYKQEIGNILISNIQGDTGGCLFKGVMNNVLMNNVFSYFHPVVQNQMEIWDGSHDSFINMFNMSGYNVGTVKRVPKKSIEIKCGVLGIDNIVFSNGTIGDSEQWPVSVTGGGKLDVTFDNVNFKNTATTNNELIWLSQTAATPITKWDLYFKNCRFTATKTTSATKVFNGTSTSLITIYRDFMTKKSGYATWANPSFTELSEVTQDPG